MLNIKQLSVAINGQPILKGINLDVKPGEVHAIMGPNGSGKSTLSKVLTGHPAYEVTHGEISYLDQDLLPMAPEERARAGIFMSFQYPVEIPGVTNINFLKASVNAVRKGQNKKPLDAIEFLSFIREKCQLLDMDESFLYRSINEGFSGGEKKRNEILQMIALEPRLAILDETDSGLDIDALRIISQGVNTMRSPERAIILVTHYQRLLDYIEPDFIHVLADGRIVKSGDKSLAIELERKGYSWLEETEQA
ncbi:Fe-S cluster assembly ATPase SufC [Legionella micdadei]|uniref:Iron-regulated ABC transporter ATPase subunit SufC n=1 Tax=Legionella micdadei TaxID=451 RepID=A0A098GE86_LEGMI|nr:Fe-S cluster assembly ATPase SufC [Legionella micdadei]ARG98061.1 ABC transporter ATP-binding protein [Legionella micdadei]ARH00855.1 ABC transporter ATP-binding protein [Legionella micdadei]KTD30112.1 ATP transporter ATP- binding protein [Legionella micdadei]NSL18513.1 Fe-S cluster assembly ATPase SufC [Legionella micdadei]CEG60307.1 putative ATP-dependent transporter ycf16 [Legionella micdadei]